MPFPGQSWPPDLKVVAYLFHSLAIASGIFRSSFRWYISRFGWEDAWALFALLSDVGCLIGLSLQRPVPLYPSRKDITLNWFGAVTLTSTPWAARLSMMAAIIRITNPRASIRRTSYCIAIVFGLMWIAVLVRKLYICATRLCVLTHDVAIFQLITDAVSDALLVLVPILFLRGVKISRNQRILLISSFTSSICITILSIAQSIYLCLPLSNRSLLPTHLKAALSVIICNLLILVTFAYQVYRKTDIDLGTVPVGTEPVQLSTVVPGHGSCLCSTSLSSVCLHFAPSP